MLTNIIILIVFVALTIGAGWLAIKALRAKRLWVKIAGGLGAGLLALVLAAVTFLGGKGFAMGYFPGAKPAPDMTVEGTPEQIARGEYLVNLSCIGCHSAVGPDGIPSGEHPLSGGWNMSASEGFGFIGDMVAENLTPGGKLATYSDGEVFRALRYGITKDNRLLGAMPLFGYSQLSDEDTMAIIAYLRTLPALETSVQTGDKINFLGLLMNGAGMFGSPAPAADSVQSPVQGVSAEYGKYVATYGDCRGCHGPDMLGTPASSVGEAVPNPRPFAGTLTLEQFTEMMRTGIKPNGEAFPESMPWQNAARMTDDDLAALYTYITTAP
jgi:mono/diheme cytochrome c family protein